MKRQHGTLSLFGLSAVVCLWLAAPGAASAADIAWDMVNSTDQNLVSFTTDAPVFSALGDGFQKYDIDVDLSSIPYALLDDSAGSFPGDSVGIINSASDHDVFFGATDTVNNDNPEPGATYHATWVFDISSALAGAELSVDIAAMGDFETGAEPAVGDTFYWTYQVDGGAPVQVFTATVNPDGNQTYTMADGAVYILDDPLVVDGITLSNGFTTFTTSIPLGSQLTVVFSGLADGGSESYAARNIKVTAVDPPAVVVQAQTSVQATGIATAQAGIASLVLTGATNLTMTPSGAVGETEWSWQVDLIDTALPGSGTLTVTDAGGATGSAVVSLSGTAVQIIVGSQTDIEIHGTATADAGIASLALTGTNLNLVTTGLVGDTQWTWQVNLVDPLLPGTGTLVLTDMVGGTASLGITLRGLGAAPIPALGTTGLVVLVLLLALGGVAILRRQ